MAKSSTSPRSRQSGPGRKWRNVAVVALILAAYWYQEKYLGGAAKFEPVVESIDRPPVVAEAPRAIPADSESAPAPKGTTAKVNGYDRLEGCRLIDHRDNDGDSFHVRHGDRGFELRLYYVDAPEKYLSDRYEDQRRRVADQGRDLGGLSPEQTVEVGKAAKSYTAKLLAGKPFTVYTKWESVYDSGRYYGFVELPDGEVFLSEELIDKGLARIHTKGEPTPDGQTYRQYQSHLESLDRAAREAGRGAWGLK